MQDKLKAFALAGYLEIVSKECLKET